MDQPMPRRLNWQHRLRLALNWLNFSTPLGLAVARTTGCRISRGPWGLVLAAGYSSRLPNARAFTLGNVVLFRGTAAQLLEQPALLEHESRHSWQYAACLGLPFFPLYFLAVGWSVLRSGHPAQANVFERAAGLQDGGYAARKPDASRTLRDHHR
jgi:hypothetical protein